MASKTSIALFLLLSCWKRETAALSHDNDECPLWLAPSHTGTEKEPKYGLFAGKTYQQNETLPNAELAIPLIDFVQDYNRNTPLRWQIIEFIEDHLWTADKAGSGWEGTLSGPVAIPGIGVLANFHTGISNVDFLQASVLLRDVPAVPEAGKAHPSRGANTPYYNVTLQANKKIPAGMELFADFGDIWDGNYTGDLYQDKIVRYDYDDADKIIQGLVDFYQDVPDLSPNLQEDILDFFLTKVLGTAAGKHAKTIKSLIPDNPRKLKKVLDAGGSFMYRYPDMIQSSEWLQQNGFCLNTLEAGPSTLPQAGRGAFASRKLNTGETITISPMLHIGDKELMTMYNLMSGTNENGKIVHDYDRTQPPIGKQLLLNYCFGHAESSLLLFPLGSMVSLINHRSETPNAYITWSKVVDNLPNQHSYHDYTVEELAQVDKVVVVMKVVATQPIAEGEEVFIDYGPEWEAAWQDYMKRWEQYAKDQPHPLQADEVRVMYEDQPFQTSETIMLTPYPPNVGTACYLLTGSRSDGFPMVNAENSFDIFDWHNPVDYEMYKGNQLHVVDIQDRHEAPGFFYNYTVIAKVTETHFVQVLNVPHAACTFVSRPHTSDIQMGGAFRHPIGILDSHFPQQWRDLR